MLTNLSRLLNFFLNPWPYGFLLLGFVGWRLIRKKKATVPFFIFCTYLSLIFSPLGLILQGLWEESWPQVLHLEKKDAVVILGGGTLYYNLNWQQNHYGRPVGRALEALRLYQRGMVRKIVISGGDPGGPLEGTQGETLSTTRFFKELGVPEQDLILEKDSLNTHQQAVILKDLLPKYGVKSFYLVTSADHMKRAMACFQKQNLPATPYPVLTMTKSSWGFGSANVTYLQSFLHEVVGFIFYKIMGYT